MANRERRPIPLTRRARASRPTRLEDICEDHSTSDVAYVQPVTGYQCRACAGIWIGSLTCIDGHCPLKHKSQEGKLSVDEPWINDTLVMTCKNCSGALHVRMQHLTLSPTLGQSISCQPEIH